MIAPAEKTDKSSGQRFGLIAALFIASGFSSLIYQVVWTRQLVLVFGSTTFATATVLAVFMGGLALGSFVVSRFVDKLARPFLWYGIAEGAIGLWALAVPALFAAAVPLYRLSWQQLHPTLISFGLIRFVIAAAILIIPTSLMGATLPLLARFVTSRLEVVGARVGTLYAVNTAGAVAGATLAGFAFLPVLGHSATNSLAALINFLLCGVVVAYSGSLERPCPVLQAYNQEPQLEAASADWLIRLAVISFGVSGAVSMIYEVGWTRTLLMVIGSSTYAFTVMLSTFLVGIFLGSLLCARLIDRSSNPVLWFALLEIGVCACGLGAMLLFNNLPWWNLQLNSFLPREPAVALVVRFALAALILLPLTVCLGATFPAIVKAATRELAAVGRSVGSLYSINTAGAIIGAFAAGFVLIPALGVERTLVAAAVANLIIGVVLLIAARPVSWIIKALVCALSLPLFCWSCQSAGLWDRTVLLSAQSERRHMVQSWLGYRSYDEWAKRLHDTATCLFWKDGTASTVGVLSWKDSHLRALITNGHVDASDGTDKQTQVLLAAYPLIWRPQARSVAVVGWGSGMTLGVAGLFPAAEITAIELEPSVIEASKFFHHVNHSPENNPRVHLEVNDGRNYLLAVDKKFDVIISEPSNPWQAGVCNLFTKEYFQICHQRLNRSGVLSLWLQTVEIPPENVREILCGLNLVFAHTLALTTDQGNMVVLASDEPLTINYAQLKAAFANMEVSADLSSVKIDSPEAVLARIASSSRGLLALTQGARPNEDDTNRLEYAVGSSYENRFFLNENKGMIDFHLGSPWAQVDFGQASKVDQANCLAAVARVACLAGQDVTALRWARASIAVANNCEALRIAGISLAQQGKRAEALQFWQEALKVNPADIATLQTRGLANLDSEQVQAARSDFARVLAIEPSNKAAQYHMAKTYARLLPYSIPFQSAFELTPASTPPDEQRPDMVVRYLEPTVMDSKFVNRHNDGACPFCR